MSDNASIVLAILIACLCAGGFMKCAYESDRLTTLRNEVHERAIAQSRDKCIAAGNAWVNENCLPRCMP